MSEFRAITNDDELWDACERIVATVSAEDANYTYALVRNDATHLRYKPGGFFKVHQDFLSLQSNCVDEYTLLLSLNTPDEAEAASGGRTLVYREAGGTGKGEAEAYDTTAPGAAVLFRKDLDHEGERVKTGTKNLLSLNLLGFRRTTTTQVLLVECAEAPFRKGRTEFAPIGATVEITGLKSHAFNNGRRAVVTPTPDDVAKAGRVAVKIDGEKQALAIRPVNLKRLESVADGVARLLAAATAGVGGRLGELLQRVRVRQPERPERDGRRPPRPKDGACRRRRASSGPGLALQRCPRAERAASPDGARGLLS